MLWSHLNIGEMLIRNYTHHRLSSNAFEMKRVKTQTYKVLTEIHTTIKA